LSILHARIRLFESILHLGYKLPVQKWQLRSQDEKAIIQETQLKMQQDFKKMGLIVDVPKPGFGNRNDGNTSRRFFADPDLAAEITGVGINLQIWSSNCQTHIQNLEKVQRRFLKFLAHRIDGTYPERGRSQSELLERFECQDLKTRRVNASMSFLRNLIHYRIDCSNLLSKLYFLVPRLTSRNHVCFYLPTPRIHVQKHSPLYTMCENYNVHQHAFDIFR
jgi:hypothetical protein